ncbi:MAG: hypothetical protein HQL27_03045, partial [Candidatus Omnitrophica bacterium]|nr:hypothetical protein [Candidatus Omnitrophota bacterium]
MNKRATIIFSSVLILLFAPINVIRADDTTINALLREDIGIDGQSCPSGTFHVTDLRYSIVWSMANNPVCNGEHTTSCWYPSLMIQGEHIGHNIPFSPQGEYSLFWTSGGCMTFEQLTVHRQEQNNEHWHMLAYYVDSEGHMVPVLSPNAVVELGYTKKELAKLSQMSKTKDPINIATGEMLASGVDISIPAIGPGLVLSRNYRSQSAFRGLFGYSWRSAYDINLTEDENGDIRVYEETGVLSFFKNAGGTGFYLNSEGNSSAMVKNANGSYTVTDKHGLVTNYSAEGRITSIVDRNGNALSYVYNPSVPDGTYIQDSTGRKITLNLNPDGTIHQAIDPAGKITTYAYDANGNLTNITNPLNKTVTYVYDDNHNITELWNLNGHKTYFRYDANDRCYMNYQEGDLNKVTLDFQGNGVVAVTDALNKTTTYYFNDYGLETQRTDSLGGTVTTSWNTLYLETAIIADELNKTTSFEYDYNGNLTKITDANNKETKFEYNNNDFNLLSKTTDARNKVTNYIYDTHGNLTTIQNNDGGEKHFFYLNNGLVDYLEDELNNITDFSYDAYGNVTSIKDALNNETTFQYDLAGNVLNSTSANHDQTAFSYDDSYRLLTITYPDTSSVNYGYDDFGNMTSLLDNLGSATSFLYDNGELLDYKTDPLLKETHYEFNNLGQVTSRTDRNNQTVNYSYTDVGELEYITYPDLTQTAFTYDLHSNLKTMTDSLGTATYNYDNLHRLTDLTDSQGFTVAYQYDDVGNVTKIIYPGNSLRHDEKCSHCAERSDEAISETLAPGEVAYTYDNLNRMETVTIWTGQTATYHYDTAGKVTELDNFNSTKTFYEYDTASRLTAFRNKTFTGQPIAVYEYYEIDGNGNRAKIRKYEPQGGMLLSENTAYTYNTAGNRLLSAGGNNFTYDDEGELTHSYRTGYFYDYNHLLIGINKESGGGGGCFLAGMLVTLTNGTKKPIEKIEVGDQVLAYDEQSKQMKPSKVKEVFKHDKEDRYLIVNNSLKVTPIHRVLSKGEWIEVGKLKVGNTVTNTKGADVRIENIQEVSEKVNIYNFDVEQYHTYDDANASLVLPVQPDFI